ncbi:MAG: ABC transporter substrate-binding protein [Lachnospiraceae bacterium]|nr:ABC transporter substrate-binding protein [Lachnospiraceae bacterium]
MKKLKKIIATTLLAALTLSVSACGGGDTTADTQPDSSNDTTVQTGDTSPDTEAAEDDSDQKENTELTKVQIGIDAGVLAYLPILAEENGYFEENGIESELVSFAYGIDTLNAIVLGEVQIGAAYDYAAVTRLAQKSNLRLATSLIKNQPDAWWFETTVEGATKIEDVKGKNVGYMEGTVWEYLWAKEFESAGLTKEDFNMIPFSSNAEIITAYGAGSVDVAAGTTGVLTQLNAIDGRTTLNTTGDIGQTSQAYVLADESFLTDQSDVFEGYLKALQESIDFIKENKEEAASIIADYLTLEKGDVASSLDEYVIELTFSQEDYDHVQDIADWAAENGVIEAIRIEDYTNSSAISAIYPDKVTYEAK